MADLTFREALEQIALLDEADGHELTREHALRAVAIATHALGKHPSQILAERSHPITETQKDNIEKHFAGGLDQSTWGNHGRRSYL